MIVFPSCSLLCKTLEAFIRYELQTSPQSQSAESCVTSISGLSRFSKVALLTKRQSMSQTNLKIYVVKCSDLFPKELEHAELLIKFPYLCGISTTTMADTAVRNQCAQKAEQ